MTDLADPASTTRQPLPFALDRGIAARAALGLIVLVYWLMAAAGGAAAYAQARAVLGLGVFKILWLALLAVFSYHLCAGVRHLVWDTGRGLERALILEEINEDYAEDDVEINADDIARGLMFDQPPPARRITGPRANVERFADADVRRHFTRFYGARNAARRSGSGVPVSPGASLAALAVAALEAVDAAAGVDQLLLARVEGVALVAQLDADVRRGATGGELVAA